MKYLNFYKNNFNITLNFINIPMKHLYIYLVMITIM